MGTLLSGFADLRGVFGDGFRLLGRHWPQLLVLCLAGSAARMGFLWLAVEATKAGPLLGALILPLAPISTLVSLVLMLRVTGESLPAFGDVFPLAGRRERFRSHIQVAAQVLIPFLTVYATQGLLRDDVRRYVFDITGDEMAKISQGRWDPSALDFSRTDYGHGWLIFAIVAVALVLRKVIAGYKLGERSTPWAALAGYLEALWLITLAAFFTSQLNAVWEWITTRAVVAGLFAWWQSLLAMAGAWSQLITVPVTFVGGLLSSMGDLVIVPVAWLAIGAAVHGSKLKGGQPLATHEEATARIRRIPDPVRRVVRQAAEPVVTPVRDTFEAIGKIAAAGVIPMVLFCVVFAVTGWIRVGVAWVARLVIGPRSDAWDFAVEPFVVLAEQTVYFVLTMALLSAAVNRVVLSQRAASETEMAEPSAAQAASASINEKS